MKEMMKLLETEESFDIKAFIGKMVKHWYWFCITGFIGLCSAYFIYKNTPKEYLSNAVVLFESEGGSLGDASIFGDISIGSNSKSNIQNQIGILNSYSIHLKALEQLDWTNTWYKEGLFNDTSFYNNSPLEVIANKDYKNPTGIKVYIKPLDHENYGINVDDENAKGEIINFASQGKYGEPFNNEYFSFTINKTGKTTPGDYYFTLNDLEHTARVYNRLVDVSLLDKKSEIIQLSLIGHTPQKQVDYLNQLLEVYIQYGMQKKNRTTLNTVRFIDDQLDGIVDSLELAGKNFTAFRTKNKTINLSIEGTMVATRLQELESQLMEVRMQIDYLNNLLHYMEDASEIDKVVAPSIIGITDPGLNSQVLHLADLYAKRTSLSYVAQDKNPSLILLNTEIQQSLIQLRENVRNQLSASKNHYKSIDNKKDEITMHMASLPSTEQEMINIKRSFDLNNELYTFLLQRRAEASITTASNVPDAQVLDTARLKTTLNVGPNASIFLALGLILGLAIPFIVIILNDYFNDSISSTEDIERASKFPVLGEIVRNKYKEELPIALHPLSSLAESFRSLRTNLHFKLNKFEGPKVIALHSMFPKEGKTFISANIANIFALNNKKVLLLGCDLRKPRLDKIFTTLDLDRGVSTFLLGTDSLSNIVQCTDIKNLSIINTGPIPPNPAELLENQLFEQLLMEAKKEFDIIVIDNAPIGMVTDGLICAKYADVNLVVLRQGKSHKKQVNHVNQLEVKNNLPNVGFILNDMVSNSYGNYSGYGGYGNYSKNTGYYVEGNDKKTVKKKVFSRFSNN